MWQAFLDNFWQIMGRGGFVMWPLLALSFLAVTLMVERAWFWFRNNRGSKVARFRRMTERMRRGDRAGALQLAREDRGLYARAVRILLGDMSPDGSPPAADLLGSVGGAASSDGQPLGAPGTAGAGSDSQVAAMGIDEALAVEVVELNRPGMERFMATLSTIITAAPMLGILGTVTGLMDSLGILGDQATSGDPRAVGPGIAEALFTTAAGLTVAIVVLFPYNAFRAQIDRTLGRLEALVAAATIGAAREAMAQARATQLSHDPAGDRLPEADSHPPPDAQTDTANA